MTNSTKKNPWIWIPSLYMTEGIPYIVIIVVSVIMYKRLGVSNADIGLYTSLLYLPWVIKPLWSPIVDLFGTKRKWFLSMQLVLSLVFLGVGMTMSGSSFFFMTLAFFWMGAFASATNDIASDGMYLIALKPEQQSFFVGLRNTFYRIGMITGQGLIVMVAGYFENSLGDNNKAWSYTMIIVALLMLLLTLINLFATKKVEEESVESDVKEKNFGIVFSTFFTKKNIGISLAFVLLYRLGESQLVKIASPFLIEVREKGGLGLSTSELGFIYGSVGVIALLVGGILGGVAISRDGLGKWMIPMALSLNLPNLLYIALAHFQPENIVYAYAVVIIEQFGYGFGFAAYMIFLIYLAEGLFKTSHYAIATGFMAMGMMLPGMASGFIQEYLGYTGFFIWVGIAMIPALAIAASVHYPKEFGKKID